MTFVGWGSHSPTSLSSFNQLKVYYRYLYEFSGCHFRFVASLFVTSMSFPNSLLPCQFLVCALKSYHLSCTSLYLFKFSESSVTSLIFPDHSAGSSQLSITSHEFSELPGFWRFVLFVSFLSRRETTLVLRIW